MYAGTYYKLIMSKTCFIHRILDASNAIQPIDNEVSHLIIYCLNYFRHDWNATYETGPISFSIKLREVGHKVNCEQFIYDKQYFNTIYACIQFGLGKYIHWFFVPYVASRIEWQPVEFNWFKPSYFAYILFNEAHLVRRI